MKNCLDNQCIDMKNYMEEVVFHVLNDLLKKTNCCKCRLCRMDIAAYALNQLPPKYVVTEKGEVYSKIAELHQQFEIDVTIALLKAIQLVRSNPRHPRGEGYEE